jgi:hypothetical protein
MQIILNRGIAILMPRGDRISVFMSDTVTVSLYLPPIQPRVGWTGERQRPYRWTAAESTRVLPLSLLRLVGGIGIFHDGFFVA